MLSIVRNAAVILASVLSFKVMAADEVKLVSARGDACPPVSGCYGGTFTNALIEVKNIAYQKQVKFVYKGIYSGVWSSLPASYVGPTQNNKELWRVSVGGDQATQFAISYTVNGQTYWDNNGGKDYRLASYTYDALLTSQPIGDAQGTFSNSDGGGYSAPSTMVKGSILVKNLGTGKIVKAVYTDDNWATIKEAYATYNATLDSGIEYWSYELPMALNADPAKIKIAFSYSWLGGSAWDNNYGKDYKIVAGQISH